MLKLKLSFKNQLHEFEISKQAKLADLKEHIELISKVAPEMQKLLCSGNHSKSHSSKTECREYQDVRRV